MNFEKDKHLREIFPPVKNGVDGIVDTVRLLLDSYHIPQRDMLHHNFTCLLTNRYISDFITFCIVLLCILTRIVSFKYQILNPDTL